MAVFEVWDSREEFAGFGPVLMRIPAGFGVELNPPMLAPVHNLIQG